MMDEKAVKAHKLILQGYRQVSHKYRMVAKLPDGMDGIQAMALVDPEYEADIRRGIETRAADQYRRVYSKEKLELSEEEFKAFKDACKTFG